MIRSRSENPRISRSRAAAILLGAGLCSVIAGEGASAQPASHGMVVTADSLASAAGLDLLRGGGNAIDAAVAAGFALAVTYPEAGNIGGGGFMVIRCADGRTTMIDFRETAPGAARRDMYLDEKGVPVSQRSLLGPLAAGVPGTVAGLLYALERYGTKGREEVLREALRLAGDGFPVSGRLAASLRSEWRELALFASTKKIFARESAPLEEGDTLRQPDLALTLREVIRRGKDGFYQGAVAEKIVAEMRRGGGIIDAEDLSEYRPVERAPLRGSYRGCEIVTASPPSSGGTLLIEILNMIEFVDLRSCGWNSYRAIHVLASACQRAFADRMAYLGDPDFVSIPELISKEYAVRRWKGWDSTRMVPSDLVHPGDIPRESKETTHYCTADRWGNVVSVSFTLNGMFGCRTIVEGGGFFLNNEMDDFTVKPGARNLYGLVGGEPNAIEPGKRMLSSMAPTIVLKGGVPFMALGARGGSRIPTTTAQIISNVIDFGMDIQEAVDVPRVHDQWVPDTLLYEKGGLPAGVRRDLESMGYHLEEVPWTARAQSLVYDARERTYRGGPDRREGGVALGY